MKKFLGEYGFTIIAAIVIITLVTFSSPIGNTIKKETSDLVDSFGTVSETKMDQLDNSLWEAGKSDLAIQILGHTKYLYDVGEANLTDADIVRIGDVDCYVLEVSPDQTKAKLITKDIYDVRFDTGGHNAEDVEGYVGFNAGYDAYTYNYKYSPLKTWMDNFYTNELKSDQRVLKTKIKYYTQIELRSNNTKDFNNYKTWNDLEQYAFPIDAYEAFQFERKFICNQYNNPNMVGFWSSAGMVHSTGYVGALYIHKNGWLYNDRVFLSIIGARPVFWISLE